LQKDIDLNLYIKKGFPFNPVLGWINKIGRPILKKISIEVRIKKGEKRKIKNNDKRTSRQRLSILKIIKV
jgi:hypothetical protein